MYEPTSSNQNVAYSQQFLLCDDAHGSLKRSLQLYIHLPFRGTLRGPGIALDRKLRAVKEEDIIRNFAAVVVGQELRHASIWI
jgi:hypothetical protein